MFAVSIKFSVLPLVDPTVKLAFESVKTAVRAFEALESV